MVKQACAPQRDSSSEASEKLKDATMMVIDKKTKALTLFFSLMAKYEDQDNDKVTILDIKNSLKDYTQGIEVSCKYAN